MVMLFGATSLRAFNRLGGLFHARVSVRPQPTFGPISYPLTPNTSSLGGTGTLSAPTLGYPSSQTAQPTLPYHAPVDWQSGDVAKLAYSASADMSSPTVLSHTLTDTDISNGSFTFPLPTLSALTFFQAFGSHSGTDSQYLSDIVAWGDTTAPTITTSTTGSITETSQLAVALTATDSGSGVPDLVSDGTSPGWYIDGGTNQLDYQVAIVDGAATLQWYGNTGQTYNTTGGSNDHVVVVGAIDRSGNKSTFTRTETVTQIDRTPNTYSFTNVSNATRSTVYHAGPSYPGTCTGTPLSGLTPGFDISCSISAGEYSLDGGTTWNSYTVPFTRQNGDPLPDIRITSSASYSTMLNLTIGIGLGSANWSVTTGGDPTNVGFTPSTAQNAVISWTTGTTTSVTLDFVAGIAVVDVALLSSVPTLVGVALDGTAMTEVLTADTFTGTFTLAGVTAGSHTVVVTRSSTGTSSLAIASGTIINTGASAATPSATQVLVNGFHNTTPATSSLTVGTNGVAVIFGHFNPTTLPVISANSGQAIVATNNDTTNKMIDISTASATTTPGFTLTAAGNSSIRALAFSKV